MIKKSGCGVIIVNSENKILLGQRVKKGDNKEWCFPGGSIEEGEHPLQAGVREIKEETNLDINICDLRLIGTKARTSEDGLSIASDYSFLCKCNNYEALADKPDEMINWTWFEAYEVMDLIANKQLHLDSEYTMGLYIGAMLLADVLDKEEL